MVNPESSRSGKSKGVLAFLGELVGAVKSENEAINAQADRDRAAIMRAHIRITRLKDTLHKIAQQETPGANATVKRIVRMAREGLVI